MLVVMLCLLVVNQQERLHTISRIGSTRSCICSATLRHRSWRPR